MASIFKMCGKYLIKNKYSVICYGVLCLTSSMFSMISPYISGNFIDYLIVADNISKIYRYCFAFFGLFVFNQLIGYIVNRVYISLMRGSAMRESVTDVRIILECLQEAYQMEGDMVRSGKNIHATMIYPFVRMLQEKCRDLTEEQIHKTLWKEYEISGADRMFVERASKILEPYEGESEDEK